MKKILLSLLAVFSALSMSAAIDLNDPTTYTSKVYDFVNDAALKGQTLAIGTTSAGTSYHASNKNTPDIFPCTSPEAMVDVFALQQVGSSKGFSLASTGLKANGGPRCGLVLNLKAGQVVIIVSTSETTIPCIANGCGTNEGTCTLKKSSDNLTDTVTMTSDGNLGFYVAKSASVKSITIYKEKNLDECEAPEAKITGTAGIGRVITLSNSDTNAKIYWSESKEDGYAEYTAPVTTEAATIYAYAVNTKDVKSDTISFETGAGTLIKLNGVTATRTGDNTYTVTSSQVGIVGNPTANVAYSVNGGEVQTAASGSSITVDGDFKVWAVVEGYTNSDTTSVTFVAPYVKGKQVYTQDLMTYGSDNAGLDCSESSTSVESVTIDGIDGTYYATGLGDIYLQKNNAWLYRTGKGNSNFKCQNVAGNMVFKDVKEGTVIDIYAGHDSGKVPVTGVTNGECGYNYGNHYFVKATTNGSVAVAFQTGSYIMNVTEYAPYVPDTTAYKVDPVVNMAWSTATVNKEIETQSVKVYEENGFNAVLPAEQITQGAFSFKFDEQTVKGLVKTASAEKADSFVISLGTTPQTLNFIAGTPMGNFPATATVSSVSGYQTADKLYLAVNANFTLMNIAGTMSVIYNPYNAPVVKVADFEDVTVDAESVKYFDGAWTSGSYTFNGKTDEYGYHYAYNVSSKTTTTGKLSDYALESACGGAKSGSNYAVWFDNTYYGGDSIVLATPGVVNGVYITNTTSTVDAILNGDGMSTVAGGFQNGDSYTVSFTGYNGTEERGPVTFRLAYAENNVINYAKDWKWVDLSALGTVEKIKVSVSSTKKNDWGMTTPAYFCLDDFGGVAPATDAEYATKDIPTAVTAVEAAGANAKNGKFIQNGRVVIVKNGKTYNAAGQAVK